MDERDISIKEIELKEQEEKFGVRKILKNKRSFFALLATMFVIILSVFFESNLAIQLKEVHKVEEYQIALVIVSYTFVYSLCAPFVGIFTSRFGARLITALGFYLFTIALLCMGPSELLGFPD